MLARGRTRSTAFGWCSILAISCMSGELPRDAPGTSTLQQPLAILDAFRLQAADAQAEAAFGRALAIEHDTLAVGGPESDDHTGAVYIFERTSSGWQQTQKLAVAESGWGNRFGGSVAMSGGTLVVGAYRADLGSGTLGGVFVYQRESTGWQLRQSLPPPDSMGSFGSPVALYGDTLATGASLLSCCKGAVHVFQREGATWVFQQTLSAPAGFVNDGFGRSIAIGPDAILATDWSSEAGDTYLFTRGAAGWQYAQTWSLNQNGEGDRTRSIALSGSHAVAGLWGTSAGHVATWERMGGAWSRQSDAVTSDTPFPAEGLFVALAEDLLVAGAYRGGMYWTDPPGWAQVFLRQNGAWVAKATLGHEGADPFDQFGIAVAATADRVVVGAPSDRTAGESAGAVYVFDFIRTLGDPCTKADQCQTGFCFDDVCCDADCGSDPNDCVTCSLAKGATKEGHCAARSEGSRCDDHNACTADDLCLSGACVSSGPVACVPSEECRTRGRCEPTTGACSFTLADDLSPCDGGHCDDGVCVTNAEIDARDAAADGPGAPAVESFEIGGGCSCASAPNPRRGGLIGWLWCLALVAQVVRRGRRRGIDGIRVLGSARMIGILIPLASGCAPSWPPANGGGAECGGLSSCADGYYCQKESTGRRRQMGWCSLESGRCLNDNDCRAGERCNPGSTPGRCGRKDAYAHRIAYSLRAPSLH